LIFYPSRIPDPGIKKAPDPGFATLLAQHTYINVSTVFFQDIKMDTDSKEEIEGPEPVSPSPVKANGTSK
jgi:hypothetical protein